MAAELIDVDEVNFTWAGEHVGGVGFAYLAIALLSPHVSQSGIGITRFDRPVRGVGAQYSSNYNTLVVPGYDCGKARKERVLLVHGATHAHIDEFGVGSSTVTVDHEICAYVAGVLFTVFSCRAPAAGP